MEGIRYIQAGEVLIPNLTCEKEDLQIGKYGSMREKYLKENRKGLYSGLVLSGRLTRHLFETNEMANQRIEEISAAILLKNPGPDKAADQMGWVKHQNMVWCQAEEIVVTEMVLI